MVLRVYHSKDGIDNGVVGSWIGDDGVVCRVD